MSDKRVEKVCLVIDASLARAAGGIESKHPTGMICRDILFRIRSISHRMAWGERMNAEWMRHQSRFAGTWLTSMKSMGKLVLVDDAPDPAHLETIEQHANDPGLVDIMTKDAHLLAAAIRRDKRILSLDETVRNHFAGKLRTHEEVMALAWVNPTIPDEEATERLNEGAPMDARRILGRLA